MLLSANLRDRLSRSQRRWYLHSSPAPAVAAREAFGGRGLTVLLLILVLVARVRCAQLTLAIKVIG
jgi:hypothetical protein